MKRLTKEMFDPVIGQDFKVTGPEGVCMLRLDETFADPKKNDGDLVHFKLLFSGSDDMFLPQSSYPFEHDVFGDRKLFIVPVGNRDDRFQYETIINYHKDPKALEKLKKRQLAIAKAREAAEAAKASEGLD